MSEPACFAVRAGTQEEMTMSKTNSTITTIRELRDEEIELVAGGVLSAEPLGSQQLFWDPVWWQVGQTGHLPTVSVPRGH